MARLDVHEALNTPDLHAHIRAKASPWRRAAGRILARVPGTLENLAAEEERQRHSGKTAIILEDTITAVRRSRHIGNSNASQALGAVYDYPAEASVPYKIRNRSYVGDTVRKLLTIKGHHSDYHFDAIGLFIPAYKEKIKPHEVEGVGLFVMEGDEMRDAVVFTVEEMNGMELELRESLSHVVWTAKPMSAAALSSPDIAASLEAQARAIDRLNAQDTQRG